MWFMRTQVVIVLIIILSFSFSGFESRPKKLLVFLQPYAGKKNSRSIYKKEILPMFEMAGITEEYFGKN